MTCTTKAGPTARCIGPRHSQRNGSSDFHSPTASGKQACLNEDDRVLVILAMGSNDVPPTLVRRAIDERWSIEQAARAFGQLARAG